MDRIRENRGRMPYATKKVVNESINQTISRTIITSGTTLIATLILYTYRRRGRPGVQLRAAVRRGGRDVLVDRGGVAAGVVASAGRTAGTASLGAVTGKDSVTDGASALPIGELVGAW
jgi:cytochrome oxidase assembly protein ShyY1